MDDAHVPSEPPAVPVLDYRPKSYLPPPRPWRSLPAWSLVLAMLFNQIGLLWACGVAMRFRSVQAGPLMQTPVFMALFLAPVYVPLHLLRGWIHSVARFNPITFLLESERGFIEGEPTKVATAFALALAMLVCFGVWARLGLRRAERAGA